jgi:hypothetical protein
MSPGLTVISVGNSTLLSGVILYEMLRQCPHELGVMLGSRNAMGQEEAP